MRPVAHCHCCSGFDMPCAWREAGKMGVVDLNDLKCWAYPIISVFEEQMRGAARPCFRVAVSQQSSFSTKHSMLKLNLCFLVSRNNTGQLVRKFLIPR